MNYEEEQLVQGLKALVEDLRLRVEKLEGKNVIQEKMQSSVTEDSSVKSQ